MPLLTDCIAGKVPDSAQEEGTDPDRELLYSDMICKVGHPEPPQPDGKLPEMRLFCKVNNLHRPSTRFRSTPVSAVQLLAMLGYGRVCDAGDAVAKTARSATLYMNAKGFAPWK